MGALVPTVDHRGVDVPDHRHCTGQLVGLLRTGLGWLVVLGSGRERVFHALAGRYRFDSFAGGDRKARQLPHLDGVTGDLRVFDVAAGHIPRAFRRADIGACLCHRPQTRHFHFGVPFAGRRRIAAAVRLARADRARRRHLRRDFARIPAADQQRAADGCCRFRHARHAVSLVSRCARPWQAVGRPALLRVGVRAADDAGIVPDGHRAAGPVETGGPARAAEARALGVRHQPRNGAAAAVYNGHLAATGGFRSAAGVVDRVYCRSQSA